MSVASGTKRKEGGIGEFIRLLIHAGLIALVIRTFLFQPFNIPSGSMKATLLVGDYLFVSKFSYGYSYYSLPLSPPLFSGRIMGSTPERGDIVVFRLPKDDSTDYIKRVIGLPSDRIQMIQGVLHINGTPVKRERVDDFVDIDESRPRDASAPVARDVAERRELQDAGTALQPAVRQHRRLSTCRPINYFMMGDNRHNSTDSRFPQVGFVPFQNLIGRAQIIFFSVAEGERAWEVWRWPWTVRWSRLFTIVR